MRPHLPGPRAVRARLAGGRPRRRPGSWNTWLIPNSPTGTPTLHSIMVDAFEWLMFTPDWPGFNYLTQFDWSTDPAKPYQEQAMYCWVGRPVELRQVVEAGPVGREHQPLEGVDHDAVQRRRAGRRVRDQPRVPVAGRRLAAHRQAGHERLVALVDGAHRVLLGRGEALRRCRPGPRRTTAGACRRRSRR